MTDHTQEPTFDDEINAEIDRHLKALYAVHEFDARCTCGWKRYAVTEAGAQAAASAHRIIYQDDDRDHETTVAPITLDQLEPDVPMAGSTDLDHIRQSIRRIAHTLLDALLTFRDRYR